jgi:hypothetical protein
LISEDHGMRQAHAARRRRSLAILAVLLALVGLFYAVSMARVGRQLEPRQAAPAARP